MGELGVFDGQDFLGAAYMQNLPLTIYTDFYSYFVHENLELEILH